MTAAPGFDAALLEQALALGASTMHEAGGRIGALPGALRPVDPSFRLAGPAFTVDSQPGDNLWLHRALYAAAAGDVLVVATRGGLGFGYWGEILNEAAIARRLGGLVIDGGVRDIAALQRLGFPVFSNGISMRGTIKDPAAPAALGVPVTIGDVTIRPGDLIVGDLDGVVAIPRAAVPEVIEKSVAREADEREKIALLRAGAATVELYNLGYAPDD